MLLAGSFILILNQFTLEYLLFPESAGNLLPAGPQHQPPGDVA